MILDKYIKIKISKKLIEKYGYVGEPGDITTIKVSDLPKNSTKKVNVKCDVCGEERLLEYRLYLKNYNKYNLYTCYKCSRIKYTKTLLNNYGVENPMQNLDIKEKIKETNKKLYGTEYYLQSEDKKNKSLKTCIDKYGVENPMQDEIIKEKMISTKKEIYGENFEKITEKIINTKKEIYGEKFEKILEKTKKTNNIKYNCDYPLQNSIIYNKTVDTFIDKYGCYPTQDKNIRDKQRISQIKTSFDNIKKKYEYLNFVSKNNNIYTIKCNECHNNYEITFNLFHLRRINNITLCTICNNPDDKHNSDFQKTVLDFIDSNNIKYIINDRKILETGKEIDIFLPDYNIGIECNGLYWHSELFKDKNYHKNKTDECEKQGIQLLHIWEDDWKYKRDIVKSMILNKVGRTKNRIYARKTEVKQIFDVNLVRDFLNTNHIQGFAKSSIKIGLYYEDELVSIMTFGNRKTNNKLEFELIRFCNKLNTNVIGGADKLLKYTLKNNIINTSIFSYSDNSFFDGALYKKIGFDFISETKLNYYWIVNNIREHRFNYNKKKLIKMNNSPEDTEYEIMTKKGYYRLWSCGMKKWIFKKD